jgi:hypothetical protein
MCQIGQACGLHKVPAGFSGLLRLALELQMFRPGMNRMPAGGGRRPKGGSAMRVLKELAVVKGAIFLVAWLVTGMDSTEPFDGQLVSVEPAEIRVTLKTQECFFSVNDRTKITLDGKPAKLAELPLGGRVLVLAEPSDVVPLAKRISASSLRVDGNGALARFESVRR